MNLYEINGTYGSEKTDCTIYVAEDHGGYWYAVDDSVNVNYSSSEIIEGCDVECDPDDIDMFTASKPIDSLEELERQINDDDEDETHEVQFNIDIDSGNDAFQESPELELVRILESVINDIEQSRIPRQAG